MISKNFYYQILITGLPSNILSDFPLLSTSRGPPKYSLVHSPVLLDYTQVVSLISPSFTSLSNTPNLVTVSRLVSMQTDRFRLGTEKVHSLSLSFFLLQEGLVSQLIDLNCIWKYGVGRKSFVIIV